MQRIKLIYLAGTTRSGSTLLTSLLAEFNDCVTVGEPVHLWNPSISENYCSCGNKYQDCVLWGRILREHFQADGFQEIQPSLHSPMHIIQSICILLGFKGFINPEYLELIKKLYASICAVSEAKIIVDESKFLPYLFVLTQTRYFDIHVIHILRDPRATAFSWKRAKKHVWGSMMTTLPWHVSARRWAAEQFLFWISNCFVSKEKYTQVRYEDFIEKPKMTLDRIVSRTGLKGASPFISDHQFAITHENHLVASNPSAPKPGINTLYQDLEWQTNMPGWAKMVVTLICWPMMLVYGYPIFPKNG